MNAFHGARLKGRQESGARSAALGNLLATFKARSAIVGVVGLGYVGQPLALRFSEMGYRVLGFDVDLEKVDELNAGVSRIEHISDAQVQAAVSRGFTCTSDFDRVGEADALIVCVPTPLNKHREPDLSYVTNTIEQLKPKLRPGQVVSLESTTYPGTTEEELLPRISSTGLVVGEDIFLVYSPEREDPGNANYSTHTIPKLVGGSTAFCLEAGTALYSQVIDKVVPLSSTKAAEMTKLLENIHRAVNIGLVNEMKVIADHMGIDIFEVIDAAATKPFGFTPYYPGPGLGGHCIPIDPFYLTWKAREYGVHTRFIELSGEINQGMPRYVVDKLSKALNEHCKPLRGAKILVLGIAYKKNVDDMRESPSVQIMELLREFGAEVEYSDPHVMEFPKMRDHDFDLQSVPLTPHVLSEFDAVILATNHSAFDYDMIYKEATLIIDSRGVYRDESPKIVRA